MNGKLRLRSLAPRSILTQRRKRTRIGGADNRRLSNLLSGVRSDCSAIRIEPATALNSAALYAARSNRASTTTRCLKLAILDPSRIGLEGRQEQSDFSALLALWVAGCPTPTLRYCLELSLGTWLARECPLLALSGLFARPTYTSANWDKADNLTFQVSLGWANQFPGWPSPTPSSG